MSLQRIYPPRSSARLLERVFRDPSLAEGVRHLSPAQLGKLVNHVGLADAGELLMLASTDQLRDILDEDLWFSEAAGEAERFDAERFVLWLEVMLQTGEQVLVNRLVELPEELVIMAFSKVIHVFDLDALAVLSASADESEVDLDEKALEDAQSFEFDSYTVVFKGVGDFDVIQSALVALYSDAGDLFERIAEACVRVAMNQVEAHGLYTVLSDTEALVADAAAEREDRREKKGHVSPTDARAFLSLATTESIEAMVSSEGRDPVTHAYFRAYEPASIVGPGDAADDGQDALSIRRLLVSAGIDAPQVLKLGPGKGAASGRVRAAVASLHLADRERYDMRAAELAYLTNLLVSAYRFSGAAVRTITAADAVLDVCDLGIVTLEERGVVGAAEDIVTILNRFGADKLFRIGWARLSESGMPKDISALLAKISQDPAAQGRGR